MAEEMKNCRACEMQAAPLVCMAENGVAACDGNIRLRATRAAKKLDVMVCEHRQTFSSAIAKVLNPVPRRHDGTKHDRRFGLRLLDHAPSTQILWLRLGLLVYVADHNPDPFRRVIEFAPNPRFVPSEIRVVPNEVKQVAVSDFVSRIR